MRIACLGGGPAGLYFAISMKLRDPAHALIPVAVGAAVGPAQAVANPVGVTIHA